LLALAVKIAITAVSFYDLAVEIALVPTSTSSVEPTVIRILPMISFCGDFVCKLIYFSSEHNMLQ